VYISDHAYSKEDVRPSPNPTPNPHQLLRMEGDILATLDFRQTTRSDRFRGTGNLRLAGWQPAAHGSGARQSHNAGSRPSAPRVC
jgi:hypothetical protein